MARAPSEVCRRMSRATSELLRQSRQGRGDILGRWVGLVAWSGLDGWVGGATWSRRPQLGAPRAGCASSAAAAEPQPSLTRKRKATTALLSLCSAHQTRLGFGPSVASCVVGRRHWPGAGFPFFLSPASQAAFLPQAHDLGGKFHSVRAQTSFSGTVSSARCCVQQTREQRCRRSVFLIKGTQNQSRFQS